jgi:hypothetical protein
MRASAPVTRTVWCCTAGPELPSSRVSCCGCAAPNLCSSLRLC